MNNYSKNTNETSRANNPIKSTGLFAGKLEKLREKELTCPFCKEVIKGIAAFGRHLKGHCT